MPRPGTLCKQQAQAASPGSHAGQGTHVLARAPTCWPGHPHAGQGTHVLAMVSTRWPGYPGHPQCMLYHTTLNLLMTDGKDVHSHAAAVSKVWLHLPRSPGTSV